MVRLGLGSFVVAMILALMPHVALAQGGKLTQCWVDNRGQRACGDSVPSEYVQKERRLYDQRGATAKIMPAEKTPEQRAQERLEIENAERLAAYDRYLTQSYQSVKQIEASRDERILMLDSRLHMAEKTLQDSSATLEELRSRGQPGKEADPQLQRQIREFKAAREANAAAVARIRDERIKVGDQFKRDIDRYVFLRTATAQSSPLLQR